MAGPWEKYQQAGFAEPTYNTPLSPSEEASFQAWKTRNAPNDSGEDYDLRGAFKAGVTPDPKTNHWPDTFKKPNEPTFSNESQYARIPYKGAATAGHWEGPNHDQFVPAPAPAADGPWAKYAAPAPQAAAAPGKPQSLMSDIGNYVGGIKQGIYDVPQSAFLLGSRATDAVGLSHEATPYFKKMFHDAEQFASDPESKYSKVGRAVGEFGATAPLGALKVAQGARLLPAIANGIAQGAAGAALTSNASDKPLWQQVGTGALTGGVAGAAAHGLSKGVEKAFGSTPPAPTVAQLRSRGNAMYDVAKGADVTITPQSFGTFVGDVEQKMGRMNPKLYPKGTGLLEELQKAAADPNGVTLEAADQLRQIAGDVLSSPEKGERRLAHTVIDAIDDYVDSIGPSDVMTGDPKAATSILSEARDVWKRKSKGEAIERLIDRAKISSSQFSGSGYENALRTQFRNFAKNEKAMRSFTQPERDAIRHVAEGGPVENVLRAVGKFAPRGVVSTVMSSGAGYGAGGPVGAVALPLAGDLSRRGATALTSRNAALASELMRRGGPAPAATVSPSAQALADALRRLPVAGTAGVLANVAGR